MRSMVAISVLALFVFPALPAQAEWDVKAKLTCYESFDGKIQKLKLREQFRDHKLPTA